LSAWKAFSKSTKPCVLYVAAAPASFGMGKLFGSAFCAAALCEITLLASATDMSAAVANGDWRDQIDISYLPS
jgi:hypothetical protein